jgi:hypothetical protein
MAMRRFRVRLSVRRLMMVVAVAAVPLAAWAWWFHPVRQWQRAVTDEKNGFRRLRAIEQISSGAGKVDRAIALATLVDALRSPSCRVRETAVVGLGRLGPSARPAAPGLIGALADPYPRIRSRAAAALVSVLPPGDSGRQSALPALRQLLRDPASPVRLEAACALTEFGHGRDALPALVLILQRESYRAQCRALDCLDRIGPTAAGYALPVVRALESRARAAGPGNLSRDLCVYAAETRCFLGDRANGFATLRAVADGPDADLASAARRALSWLSANGLDEPDSDPGTP